MSELKKLNDGKFSLDIKGESFLLCCEVGDEIATLQKQLEESEAEQTRLKGACNQLNEFCEASDCKIDDLEAQLSKYKDAVIIPKEMPWQINDAIRAISLSINVRYFPDIYNSIRTTLKGEE